VDQRGTLVPMAVADEIEALHHSDQRAVRTVDSLTDDQWAGPSFLPGWTRAHVVAHLALNGEAFAGALDGVLDGRSVPIYPSDAARDAAIETLAQQPYGDIRERFFAATAHFRAIAHRLSSRHWEATVQRLPDGPTWPAADLVGARQREVEIHHVDLDIGYSRADWPADFCSQLLDQVSGDHADSPESAPFAVRATDLGTTWPVGAEQPLVTGTAADLGWWLTGRGHGEGLDVEQGHLPELGPWRRSPLRWRTIRGQ